jgi:CheY-like chemotaxis protein
VKFLDPSLGDSMVVKNLSANGALVEGRVEVFQSQRVRIMLGLDDGMQLPLLAEVSWTEPEVGALGLRFVDMSSEASRRGVQALGRRAHASRERAGNETIVVADDDPDILNLFTRALTRSGYQVYQARRGEEALDLVRELRPPLVLLDILMPGIDGVEICKAMRADAELADIPVIFLSALDATRLHSVADEAGATDYLSKPILLADLDAMVAAYLPRQPRVGDVPTDG